MIIGIVEDDKKYIEIIKRKLVDLINDDQVSVLAYTNKEQFEFDLLKKHIEFDILIMDIELNDNNSGIDLTTKTNRLLPYCQAIYLTAYIKYVSDVYMTEHLFYINKKDFDKYFSLAVNKAIQNVNKRKSEVLSISWNKAKYDLRQDNIVFIERSKKTSIIHLSDNSKYKSSKTLDELYNLLNQDFVRTHESFIVNLNYISTLNKSDIRLNNGSQIPLSRRYTKEIKNIYNRFLAINI